MAPFGQLYKQNAIEVHMFSQFHASKFNCKTSGKELRSTILNTYKQQTHPYFTISSSSSSSSITASTGVTATHEKCLHINNNVHSPSEI
jgi:hypothetical protein